MSYRRDPVSELFDSGARRLLERAYARRGQWVGTRLADPSPGHVALFAAMGINVLGPDNAATRSGRHQQMQTRWARGFARAVYYQHKWYYAGGGLRASRRMAANTSGAVEIEIGRAAAALGIIPAGRAVRVRVLRGGAVARRAVGAMADADRVWTDGAEPGGRFSDADGRDWQ